MVDSRYKTRLFVAVAAVFGMVLFLGAFQDDSDARRRDKGQSADKKVAPSGTSVGKKVAPAGPETGRKVGPPGPSAGKKVGPLADPNPSVANPDTKGQTKRPPAMLTPCRSQCAATRDRCVRSCAGSRIPTCEAKCTNYYAGCVNRCMPKLSPR
jgi:hypothetical protein